MNAILRKHLKSIAGSFAVEMAIALPFVATFVFAGIEFGNVIHVKQSLTGFSRDAANTTKRLCTARFEGSALKSCADRIANEYAIGAKKQFKDFDQKGAIVISVFKKITAANGTSRIERVSLSSNGNNGFVNRTRYSSAASGNMGGNISMSELFEHSPNLTISEVFYEPKMLTPFHKIIEAKNDHNGVYYDTAIF